MQKEREKVSAGSIPVREILATTSDWIHVLGSDQNHYLVPAVLQTYSYKNAYCDSVILSALGITTLDAEILSFSEELVFEGPLEAQSGSTAFSNKVVGWRLPKEKSGVRLLQILPLSWLKRVTNREQFLEVLILDLWFRRSGHRQVIFLQAGSEIQAVFIPSGNCDGVQRCTAQQVGYYQSAVYSGLPWATIEVNLKVRIESLSLANLARRLRILPQMQLRHEVLKSLWFETTVNKVCFDQHLTDAVGALFGGAVHRNTESAIENLPNQLRSISSQSRRYALGRYCS